MNESSPTWRFGIGQANLVGQTDDDFLCLGDVEVIKKIVPH